MDTQQKAGTVPMAPFRKRRRVPLVWIVPVLTALLAVWLAWDTFSKRGPTITISFETAAGLTAGQSQLKYKNVVMGTVQSIAIAPDLASVIVTVETTREAERLLFDTTVFWVVKPQLSGGNISGLDTLLSGSYIAMRPHEEGTGKPQQHFVGLEDPPILQAWTKGTTYKLETKRVGSISPGSPIFFRDLEVGTVLGWGLGNLATKVTIHAFVRAPFDQYVREDSSFWNASGLSVRLAGEGISVQMESLRALLLGGVAFDTPHDAKEPPAKPDQTFTLYANFEAAKTAGFTRRLHVLSYFPGSVAGLSAGADVTLYGLKIGEVTDVDLTYDKETDRIVAPVHYQIDAGRIAGISAVEGLPPGTIASEFVKRGLRATLQAPSLISGHKIIALEMLPNSPPAELRREGDVFIMPASEASGFDSIGKSLSDAAAGLDNTINGPELKATLVSLDKAMAEVQGFTRRLDQDGAPALKRLPAIAAELQETLRRTNRLMGSLNTGYGEDSRFRRDLDRLLPQLTDMARSLRALTDLLSRYPEALITGRPTAGK